MNTDKKTIKFFREYAQLKERYFKSLMFKKKRAFEVLRSR